MNNIYNLDVNELSDILNIPIEDMPVDCKKIIKQLDFRYRSLDIEERDHIILDLIKKIDEDVYTKSDDKLKWQKGWGEILSNFSKDFSKESLIPQYFKKSNYARLYGDYIKPLDNNFENNFVTLLRSLIFNLYFKDIDNVYEFGCGSCANLFDFVKMGSSKCFYGFDWVEQPSKIIELIKEKYNYNIEGGVFDMFNPDYDLEIKNSSVSLTVGALEQLGCNYDKFLQFLLDKPFSRHVHLNSIIEFYDQDKLNDYLVYKMERHRNYLNGFFDRLIGLEKDNIIKIIKMDRIKCSGFPIDGYSITVWEKV